MGRERILVLVLGKDNDLFVEEYKPCLGHSNVTHDLPLSQFQRGLRLGRLGLLKLVIRSSGRDCNLLCWPGPHFTFGRNFLLLRPRPSEAGSAGFPSCEVNVLNADNWRGKTVVRSIVQHLRAAAGEQSVTFRFARLG